MALPTKFHSPNAPLPQIAEKIPMPTGPSASSSSTPNNNSMTNNNSKGSMATDWQTSNDIQRQQLQAKHGISADEAKDLTDNNDDDNDND